jgi:hypothetical protein
MRFVVALLACTSVAFAQTKKLIEFGWDEPDAAFMRAHIAEMERTSFDGTVFHLNQDFLWQCWGKRAFTEAELKQPIADLKATPIKRFTHNFLRFNVTPGDVDWFDDFRTIVRNARLAARIAREGRAAGILFDIEQYNSAPFNYAKQRDAKTKSFDEYAAQAKKRGAEVMNAFQEGFGDLVVLMTWAHSLPHQQTGGDTAKLAAVDYGLLKPFLDGMFEAARGKAKIVDGFESSYSYKDAKQFDDALKLMRAAAGGKAHASAGYGLWMDYDWRNKAWDEKDFSKNHFSPAEFEKSLKMALERADEFVWVYTETPRWWGKDGQVKLPAEYVEAVKRAVAAASTAGK